MVTIVDTDKDRRTSIKTLPAVRGGALDALRFWASLMIVLYHFGAEAPMKLTRLHPVFERGYLATDFFLMLSGFVLGLAYGPQVAAGRVSDGRFLLRRVARIWPGHVITLLAFAVVVFIANRIGTDIHNPSRFVWADLPAQLLLIHAWGVPGIDGWNLPSWSLSALIPCYALFPLLWRGLLRLKPALLAPILGLLVIIVADLLCWRYLNRPFYDLPLQFGVARAAPLFLLGAGLARAVEAGWPDQKYAQPLLIGGGLVLGVVQLFGRIDYLSLPAIAAIVLGAGRLPIVNPSRRMALGAKLSYALFITHTFVGLIWYTALHTLILHVKVGLEYQWPLWALGFPLSLWAAWAFDRWIDAPLQQWLEPWVKGPAAKPYSP